MTDLATLSKILPHIVSLREYLKTRSSTTRSSYMWQVSAVLLVGLTAVSGAFKLYYDKAEAQKEAIAVQLRQSHSLVKHNHYMLLENSIADLNNQVLQAEQDKEEAFKRITALQEANAEAREEVDNLKSKFDKHNMNVLSLRKPKLIENIINRGTKEVLNELENITNPASSNM